MFCDDLIPNSRSFALDCPPWGFRGSKKSWIFLLHLFFCLCCPLFPVPYPLFFCCLLPVAFVFALGFAFVLAVPVAYGLLPVAFFIHSATRSRNSAANSAWVFPDDSRNAFCDGQRFNPCPMPLNSI